MVKWQLSLGRSFDSGSKEFFSLLSNTILACNYSYMVLLLKVHFSVYYEGLRSNYNKLKLICVDNGSRKQFDLLKKGRN